MLEATGSECDGSRTSVEWYTVAYKTVPMFGMSRLIGL